MDDIVNESDLKKLPHRKQVMFALFCAQQIAHLVHSQHKTANTRAISTVELWLEGRATAEQCRVTSNAACYGGDYGVVNAARTVVYAANAAYYAAGAINATYIASNATITSNNREKIRQEQWDYYDALLNLNKYAEELLDG